MIPCAICGDMGDFIARDPARREIDEPEMSDGPGLCADHAHILNEACAQILAEMRGSHRA